MTSNMGQKLAIQTRAVSWLQSQKKLKIGTSQKSQIQSEMIQIFNLEHSHSGLKENLWFVYLQSRHIFCLFNITWSWIDCFECNLEVTLKEKNFNSEEGKLVNGQWLIWHSTDQTFVPISFFHNSAIRFCNFRHCNARWLDKSRFVFTFSWRLNFWRTSCILWFTPKYNFEH